MAYPQTMRGEGPIEETVRAIARDPDFEVIELTWIKDDAMREKVKRMVNVAHMDVAYGAQPRLLTTGLNINSLEEAQRLQAVETLRQGIDEAYELGAEGLAFLSGKYDPARREEAFDALLRSTRTLCAYAKSKGRLRIALEVFDYDIDKRSLIGPAGLARRFAEQVLLDFDNFGLLVDLSHIPMLHETVEESILPVAPYIIHAHMGNTVIADPFLEAYGDTHPRFGFPGSENDVEELAAYLRVLLRIGFLNRRQRPILSFEVKPWGDEEPELVIANAKRALAAAWVRA
ncbi:MAG TPA: TIM barrel protein [Clostridia bacterium]|nr:TIM barrel protein [Clostridia bacterium]